MFTIKNFFNIHFYFKLIDELKAEDASALRKIYNYIKLFIAEFMGMFFFMFLGCGCYHKILIPNWNIMVGQVMFGFVYGSCAQLVFHITNAHLNPIITLCYYIFGYISIIEGLIFVVAQLAGSVAGFYALIVLITSTHFKEFKEGAHELVFCSTVIHKDLDLWKGFVWEFAGSVFLILVICSIIDPRNESRRDSYSIKISFAYAFIGLPMVCYTGGAINPARSFGPALINGDWSDHWVYWAAPFSGSLVASLLYYVVFLPSEVEPDKIRRTRKGKLGVVRL